MKKYAGGGGGRGGVEADEGAGRERRRQRYVLKHRAHSKLFSTHLFTRPIYSSVSNSGKSLPLYIPTSSSSSFPRSSIAFASNSSDSGGGTGGANAYSHTKGWRGRVQAYGQMGRSVSSTSEGSLFSSPKAISANSANTR